MTKEQRKAKERIDKWESDNKELLAQQRKEYNEFMKRYNKLHECCPKCGGTPHSSTLAGFIMRSDNREAFQDLNDCVCSDCGDEHVVHDRVPKK